MANLTGIVGDVSTGKSTSLRNLDPKSTYIINVLSKQLPWRGSAKAFSPDKKNIANVSEWRSIIDLLKAISEKRTEVKTIVLDDSGFVMSKELFNRSKETGYGKFTDLAQHFQEITETAISLRSDLNVVFMFHEELIVSDGMVPRRKIKTVGKMLDDKWTPEALFSVLLYTHVESGDDGPSKYYFITNRTGDIPAKSPMGMFQELKIENDLKIVIDQINSFYEGD